MKTCTKIKTGLNGNYSQDIPTISAVFQSLPSEVRACSKCGEEVILETYPINVGSGVPIGGGLVGCEAEVHNVVKSVLLEGVRRGLDCEYWFEQKE